MQGPYSALPVIQFPVGDTDARWLIKKRNKDKEKNHFSEARLGAGQLCTAAIPMVLSRRMYMQAGFRC